MLKALISLLALALVTGASTHSSTDTRAGSSQLLFQVTALTRDCRVSGDAEDGGVQFIAGCPMSAPSHDRRLAVATSDESGAIVLLEDGQLTDDLTALSDAMPFVVYWSPLSDMFFVNHYLGSSLDRLRVFEVVNHATIERSDVMASATRVMVARFPCLARHARVVASGWRWSSDGRRIALVAYARPDACLEQVGPNDWRPMGDWDPLWMIGDVASGEIDPDSVRVRKDGVGSMPKDGPYATL